MIWPFRRKPLLDDEMSEWMLAQVEWLLRHHSHRNAFAQAQLVPVSDRLFPSMASDEHGRALDLFDHVKRLAKVSHLRTHLIRDEDHDRFQGAGGLAPQPKMTAAGTYQADHSGRTVITYAPHLSKNPADLVTVLAHELSHAILDFGASMPAPGHADFEEIRTDLCAVMLGFGLFIMQFRSESGAGSPEIAHEWRELYMYYMSLREACFATALFCRLHNVGPDLVLRHAPQSATGHLRRAFRDLRAYDARIAALQAVMASHTGEERLRLV